MRVGGAGTVSVSSYDGFDFVALGHLHRPQLLANGRIHYAGSLMKYSFAEASHQKSVSLVAMAQDGTCTIEKTELSNRELVADLPPVLRITSGSKRHPRYVQELSKPWTYFSQKGAVTASNDESGMCTGVYCKFSCSL